LDAFTLDYCYLKIKVFYIYLQHHGNTQAMKPNCSNLQILPDCIVWNGILPAFCFRKYYYKYITLTCSMTYEMIWPVVPNLEFFP